VLEENLMQRYVYNTALELQKNFSDYINIETLNIVRNPTAVSKYKINANTVIDPSDVIISFGTESRIKPLRQFYIFNTDSMTDETPWAYNGEYTFASAILATTRAESPIACLTVEHGENYGDCTFETLLEDAGFKVQKLNLKQEEIPEDCRLIVICNPTSDFLEPNGTTDIDEIGKIDKFLDATNSLMVFIDPEQPRLANLENYLEEWGVSFDRYNDAPRLIQDKSASLLQNGNPNFGYTFFAEYVQGGYGGYITESLAKNASANRIVFENAMSISYADSYKLAHHTPSETATNQTEYDYAEFSKDGYTRSIYDVFTTSANAKAISNDIEVESANDTNKLKLMTVTLEQRRTPDTEYSTIDQSTYVYACGSPSFLSSKNLIGTNAYGNRDLLLTVLRDIGREPVPVGLEFRPFADSTIDTITTVEATQYTIVLAIVPAVIAVACGTVVIVRRKNR
jgi:hypothetical protein